MAEYLHREIEGWAADRGILRESTPLTQLLKTVEELSELAEALKNGDRDAIIDGFGDVLVTLIIIRRLVADRAYEAWLVEDFPSLEACLEAAYQTIKNRKGQMVDGFFVKEKE